jgi:hypothetical protein
MSGDGLGIVCLIHHYSVDFDKPHITMKIDLKNTESRREFLVKSSRIGLTCGALSFCLCNHVSAEDSEAKPAPDPKKLNYCGYVCPAECPMKLAGESGDVEQKKAAYDMWHIKERYGLDFDPDQVFCDGCKTDKEELGVAVSNCVIRKCAVEKELDCCIECDELAACEKGAFKAFHDFHKSVIEMQKQYQASMG